MANIKKQNDGGELGEVELAAKEPGSNALKNNIGDSSQNPELIEIIKRFAPEVDTSTPEGVLEGALTVLKSMVPVYDKLYDVVLANPEAAAFVSDLLDTGNPVKALVRNFDPEEVQAALEEAESGDHEEDRAVHSNKVIQARSRENQVRKNMEISFNDISEFMEERKDWPEEKAEAFQQFVIKHYEDGKDGLINKDALLALEKSFNYDGDMAAKDNAIVEAETNGKIIGRNEKIVTEKLDKKGIEGLLPEANGSAQKQKEVVKPTLPVNTRKEFRV